MKKEQYLDKLEQIKKKTAELQQIKNNIRELYIEYNKPCEIGDHVRITLHSGRIVLGEVKQFSILEDDNVYVTAFKEGSSTKYITKPYQKLDVL